MVSIIATSASTPRRPSTIAWGRVALISLATIAAAVLANVLVYLIGGWLVGYDPRFVVLATVDGTILFTLVPAIGAVLLYAGLLRFARRPARVFTFIAAVVFIVTLIPDFTYIPTVPGATVGQTAVLVLMHVVAASVIVSLLTTLARRD